MASREEDRDMTRTTSNAFAGLRIGSTTPDASNVRQTY
jgi:hypothetical protein